MADVLTRLDAWLWTKLHGDSTLLALLATDSAHTGVYVDEITPPPLYPAVVITNMSALDVTALGPQRNAVNSVWLVKAIVQGRSYVAAQAIMDRVDAVLQTTTSNSVYDATVWTIVSEQSIQYAENDVAGEPYRHLGRRYRLLAPPQ